jgi:hypothetical protein
MADASSIRERYAAVGQGLNERARRLFAAAEARTAGYGGIAASNANNFEMADQASIRAETVSEKSRKLLILMLAPFQMRLATGIR